MIVPLLSSFPPARVARLAGLVSAAALAATLPALAQTPVDEHPAIQAPPGQGIAVEPKAPKPANSPSATPAPGTKEALALEKRTADSSTTPFNRNPPRHQQFLDRLKLGKIDLLFIGDSIMDGMPRTGEATWLRFAPYNPADFGVSGERTEDVLWRLQNGELEGIQPKVAVVLIGTNNFGFHKAEQPEWATAGVKKIVDTIHGKLPDTKVLLLGIFPRGTPDEPMRAKIEAVNAALAKLDDGKATRFLDFGKKFLGEKGAIPEDIMHDKLHPTAKGYEIWWEAMHPLLDEMMGGTAATAASAAGVSTPAVPPPPGAPMPTVSPTPPPSAAATPSAKVTPTPKAAKPK